MNGLSFTLCFGKSGGFHIVLSNEYPFKSFRICLFWAALTIYLYDLEAALEVLVNKYHQQPKVSHLTHNCTELGCFKSYKEPKEQIQCPHVFQKDGLLMEECTHCHYRRQYANLTE